MSDDTFLIILYNNNMKKIIITILSIAVVLSAIFIGIYEWYPFQLKKDEITINLHSKFNPYDNIKNVFMGSKEDVKVKSNVDTSSIHTSTISYTLRQQTKKIKVHVKDLQAPVLKLKPYSTDTVEKVNIDNFVESCKDDSDYTIRIMTKNTEQVGDHTIKIKAKDQYGNSVTKSTHLIRTKDEIAPEITQNSTFMITAGDSFDFKNAATCKDNVDPNPEFSYDASKVNTNIAGTYPIIYTAKDRSGNTQSQTFNLVVKEKPVEEGKIVYLTFDDGPSQNTKKILDILDQYNIKATFFVTGRNPNYSNYIQEAYSKGHTIGLHTYTHNYASVYASVDDYFNDLNQVSNYVHSLIGIYPTAIRFPGGSSNTISANYSKGIMTQLTTLVQQKGYQYYDWNCDSTDASGNNIPVDTLVKNATSSNADQINILCHDTDAKGTTVSALPQIIEYYKSRGYSFKAITPNSFAPHHGINN